MKKALPLYSLLAVALTTRLAAQDAKTPSTTEAEAVRQFQASRTASLRSPDSWLTLVGLFWLTPNQDQTIGSGSSNDFVLPPGSSPPQIGRIRLTGNQVMFTNLAGAPVKVDGKPVSKPILLRPEDDEHSSVHVGSVSFYVIQRGGKTGLRAKDSNSPVLRNFHGLTYFPPDPALHFAHAHFIKDPKKIPILNVLGQTDLEDSPGIVEIHYQGKAYRLRPLVEGDTLFFLFKDLTNKTETYQAGRMLNTPLPKGDSVDVDFNLSYNPPCTFTVYATCPLPPKENQLPFPVTAGEKRYGHGHPA